MTAVRAAAVTKRYRKGALALDGLDLHIEEGEVFGLLGPNGAGKTTFVKCLLDLLRPSSGSIEIFGSPSSNASVRKGIGYVPELPRFPDFLTAREVMQLHARLLGEVDTAQISRLLSQADLEDSSKRVRSFSKGMVRRLALAQSLLGSPQLLVLDEPTADLDPLGRRDVRNLLVDMKERNVSVLLNSHLLSEVERVCDRVAIMHRGRLLASGTVQELVPEGSDLETVFVALVEKAGG